MLSDTHLLLAEESQIKRKYIQKLIESKGYQVTSCATNIEAINRINQTGNFFNLLVVALDNQILDTASGIQMLRNEMHYQGRIIAYGVNYNEKEFDKWQKIGCNACVNDYFAEDAIILAIEKQLTE